jgi:hypothetical protein
MSMAKLVQELLNLLREMLGCQERLLRIAMLRQDAMRAYDVERLNGLLEEERGETQRSEEFTRRRVALVNQFRVAMGKGTPEPTVSEIAKRLDEPLKSQLLALAAHLRSITEKLERNTRINATVSEAVLKSISKVLKIVTGLAQHAGLYMRNGRKAAVRGIHLLEVTA